MVDSGGSSELRALRLSREGVARTASGYPLLLILVVDLALIVLAVRFLAAEQRDVGVPMLIVAIVAAAFIGGGFYLLQPNQAAAITLFGDYKGTDRTPGLRWVLPWMSRKRISTRVHNVTSERLKVNDLRGNPIEIASNVVWRVTDTAQALFDVDDYEKFIFVQIESAVRAIGAKYPYDDFEHQETTLRGHADEVNGELRNELQERVLVAGITIDACRLTHLANAPEIAQAMLRRQQAEAVIAAREKIVHGAVTMVDMALRELAQKDVVHLDDERRAAMVSNLMVVLCGESEVHPVVNTGTLYN